jgi:hypothetical protein
MSAHTPAPWVARTYSTETVRDAVGIYAGSMLLPIVPDIAGRSIEECDANIRLIAAAPDLLAALQMVNRVWSHDQTANLAPDSPVAIVRAAITKATGETA